MTSYAGYKVRILGVGVTKIPILYWTWGFTLSDTCNKSPSSSCVSNMPLVCHLQKTLPFALRKENAPSYFICISRTWGREEGTSFILAGRHYLAVCQCHVLEPLRTCHNSSITPHIHRLSRRTVTLQHDHIILARWHNTPCKVLKYSPPNKYEGTPS